MTDKKQAAKGQAPRKKEKASVDPCGSGQFLAEYRNLLDNCYTVPIRWGDAEGQEVLQGWAGKFIDRIRKWTRANLPDRSYGFILEKVITDISAYEFLDEPVFRKDGSLDEGKSKVRFDYTNKVPNDAPGAVMKEVTFVGTYTALALFETPLEIGQQANARDAALWSIRDTVFAAIHELIGQLPAPIPKPFERTAIAQYDKMLKDELPGFSICPFPKQVSIGTRHTYPTLYGGTEGNEAWVRDPARWDDIGRAVRNSGRTTPDSPLRDLLDGWSYATIVPDGIPNPNDIPNPKIYLLDGAMIPDESMERGGKRLSQVANTIIVQFGAMVRRAWESPINLRDQAVTDLLDHHFKHGGNPVAFVKHVERITPNYKVDELRGLLSGWVASKGDHNSTATTKPKPAKKSSAFTVPVLARFCWCMEKAGHSDHGIVNATAASRLANHYGLLHKRTGEKLKQERDRFDGADGKPYLKGGPRSNEAYGRRTWAAVKVELERIGYSDAVRLAEAILSDL